MKNNVLIYVRDGLIEDDIIATVQDVLDNASIRVADSVEAVRTTLESYKGWAWAVVDVPSEVLGREDLRAAFAQNDALPVVLAPKVDDPAVADWVFLDPPFTTDMLREALERTRPY